MSTLLCALSLFVCAAPQASGQLDGFGTYPGLTLTYQNLPQLQYGQVIFAPATCVGSSTPIGSGVLCVCHDPAIGGICRGPVFNTASGSGSVPIDLLNPANASQPCQSFPGIFIGTTWNFQIYHRDVVAPGVNLTNGIEVVVG